MKFSGRLRRLVAAAALAGALGGCVEQVAQMSPETPSQPALVKREGVSLGEATVAFVSVDGAPDALAGRFQNALAAAAKSQDIALVEPAQARYLVRGYLSTAATDDGVAVEFVWDVFGPDRQRAFRLDDTLTLKGKGDDPWAIVTPDALQSIAAKTAGDLAAFLSRSPEAKPLAASGAPALTYAAAN